MVVKTTTWIPAHRRAELRQLASRSHQIIIVCAFVGAATGLLVAAFDRLVVDAAFDHVLLLEPWLIAVLPGAGLLAAYAARRFIGGEGTTPATADEYLHAFHDREHRLGVRQFVGRIVAALATLGTGGPMGLEGPSLYTGATLGATIHARLPRLVRGAERRVLLVAGAAAGVAAIFKAPATGAIFAIEVPYQDDLARRMLLPSLVASASGYLAFASINGTSRLFPIDGNPEFVVRDLLGALAIGVVAGLGARGFAWMLRRAKRLATGSRPVWTALAAGVGLAGIFVAGRLLTGESLMVGSGYEVVAWASDPVHSLWLLIAVLALRCMATSVTVAGGGVGGLFIPLVVAGALTGSIVSVAVDQSNLSLFIVVGVAAFLGAGYRVPLAAVMFVAETTGRPSFIVPGLLAAVAAELMMGASSVTRYQVPAKPMTEAGNTSRA